MSELPSQEFKAEKLNGKRSGFSNAIRLLSPGLNLKRWLLLGALGVILGAAGIVYLAKYFLSLPLPKFLPLYLEGVLLICLSAGLVALALFGLYRSLAPVLFTSRTSSNGIAHTIYARRQQEKGPRVVAVGGGTGLSTLLRGLKEHTSNLTAIVTVADDGGSSGRLRKELGILPPGDFRNCLVAMADAEPLVTKLFQYRFGKGSGLEGHSFGNLFIVAMSGVTGSFEQAIQESSNVLAVKGRILPSTLSNLNISARMEDESIARGESNITKKGGKIKQLYLEPANPEAYSETTKAIKDAQLIVIGPGSLYTSILPNLLVPGIGKAVKESKATKIYVCNVATQSGETDGFSVRDHLVALQRHTLSRLADYVIANNNLTPLDSQFSGSLVGLSDWDVRDVQLIQADLINPEFRLHHDSQKLASAVMNVYYNKWRGKHGESRPAKTDRTTKLEQITPRG